MYTWMNEWNSWCVCVVWSMSNTEIEKGTNYILHRNINIGISMVGF